MASENIFEVAERTKLWDPKGSIPFNFLRIYGKNQGYMSQGSTRRMWRAFTMANPAAPISPFTDEFASFGYGPKLNEPYPFSLSPQSPMELQSIMRILRDNYEGTPFDLTEGADAGPFGDVVRAGGVPSWQDPVNGLQPAETNEEDGTMVFPNRAISLWRTSYGSIAQARASLPNTIGALTWFAQNAPHHSSFVPVYANTDKTPDGIDTATQYKFDKSKNFWVHSVVGNYVSRWFKHTIADVRELQVSYRYHTYRMLCRAMTGCMLLNFLKT
jgi:dipeptidase